MCEVTKKNFIKMYPQIIEDLHSASFVAIDCEFSGLFGSDCQNSLFDTPEQRFKKLQQNLKNYAVIQLGLSTFQYNRDSNKFFSSSYSFYLLPSEFFLERSKFLCEINSTNFLCKHNFNFNKLFYEGISYISNNDKEDALKMLQDEIISYAVDQEEIQKYCSGIAEWLKNASEESEYCIEVTNFNVSLVYFLHKEIRNRFSNAWTYYENQYIIKIKKISDSEHKKLILSDTESALKEKFINSILGFSHIIREIENLKKPIVGHNCLVDFIMIYKQFYDSSHISYETFKHNLNKLFPVIYDTKLMSFKLKNMLSKNDVWQKSNSLSDLYFYFTDGKGANIVMFTPTIEHRDDKFLKCTNFHEASFDSYCTGFLFIKMAHMFSLWNNEKHTFLHTLMPTTFSWLLGAVKTMKNCINMSRNQVLYIVIDGPDPKADRPGLLHVQSTKKQPINIVKLSEITAKFGQMDIKRINKYRVLLAVTNKVQQENVIQCLKDHKDYKISHYSFIKHSYWGQGIVTGTVSVLSALFAFVILKKYRK